MFSIKRQLANRWQAVRVSEPQLPTAVPLKDDRRQDRTSRARLCANRTFYFQNKLEARFGCRTLTVVCSAILWKMSLVVKKLFGQ